MSSASQFVLNMRGVIALLMVRCRPGTFTDSAPAAPRTRRLRRSRISGAPRRAQSDSEQYLRAREAEAMCDVWIFEARTLSTQPVRVTQESGRHGPAPGDPDILDDSEQYLRAREAEAMCDHVWICATGADGAGFARRYWLSPNSANAWPLQGRIDIVAF
jgi:hypothetical protein